MFFNLFIVLFRFYIKSKFIVETGSLPSADIIVFVATINVAKREVTRNLAILVLLLILNRNSVVATIGKTMYEHKFGVFYVSKRPRQPAQ